MPKFILTKTERYIVEAENAEIAAKNFSVLYNDGDAEIIELLDDDVIDQDAFEYLDGKTEIEEEVED